MHEFNSQSLNNSTVLLVTAEKRRRGEGEEKRDGTGQKFGEEQKGEEKEGKERTYA